MVDQKKLLTFAEGRCDSVSQCSKVSMLRDGRHSLLQMRNLWRCNDHTSLCTGTNSLSWHVQPTGRLQLAEAPHSCWAWCGGAKRSGTHLAQYPSNKQLEASPDMQSDPVRGRDIRKKQCRLCCRTGPVDTCKANRVLIKQAKHP